MRLIDGHELKKTFEAWRERLMQKAEMKLDVINVWATERQIELIDAAIDELERMPEIREEPARHGRWEECSWEDAKCKYGVHTIATARCSECNLWCEQVRDWTARVEYEYCPHCGARMDGD